MSTNYSKIIVECMQNEKLSKEIKLKKIEYILKIAEDSINGYHERKTPLLWANEIGDKDFIELFEKHGGVATRRPPTQDERAVLNEKFASYVTAGMLKEAKACLDDGADVETSITKDGRNPLIVYCAGSRDAKTVEFLLDNNAFIETPDKDGVYPLINAIVEERYDNVKLLVERGANILTPAPWGSTAYEIANDELKKVILDARKVWCDKNNIPYDGDELAKNKSKKENNARSGGIWSKLQNLVR